MHLDATRHLHESRRGRRVASQNGRQSVDGFAQKVFVSFPAQDTRQQLHHVEPGHRAVLMSVCKSGSERRELLERAVAAGVELDTSCYNLVLSQLQIEGCAEELHKLLAEMTARGVEPDRHTERVQRRTVGHLASIRTTELKKLIDAGSLERAWELFDGLLERGQADSGHFQLMMNQACADYASKQALRRRAVEAGWHPTQMSGRAMPGAPETGGGR